MEITSKELYKARPQIMGVAALLVIIVHLLVGYESHFISSIHRFAQIGVDMFFFLSGIGCYQSIATRNIKDFYWRRIKRIIPNYLIVLFCYGVFKYQCERVDILTYWRTNSIFMFPINGETQHWFIFGILAVYLLTPIFYKMMGRYSFWITFITIILVSSQLYFLPPPIPNNLYLFNELFITRIPIYMLGLYFGYKFSKNETITIDLSFYLKLIGITLLGFWNNYFNQVNSMSIFHYISIFGTMYFTFFLVIIFNKIKILPLEWLGKSSLESYLVNEKIIGILAAYTTLSVPQVNFYGIVLTIVVATILKAFINLILERKLCL